MYFPLVEIKFIINLRQRAKKEWTVLKALSDKNVPKTDFPVVSKLNTSR